MSYDIRDIYDMPKNNTYTVCCFNIELEILTAKKKKIYLKIEDLLDFNYQFKYKNYGDTSEMEYEDKHYTVMFDTDGFDLPEIISQWDFIALEEYEPTPLIALRVAIKELIEIINNRETVYAKLNDNKCQIDIYDKKTNKIINKIYNLRAGIINLDESTIYWLKENEEIEKEEIDEIPGDMGDDYY